MRLVGVSVLVVLLAAAGCSRNPAPAPAANPGATTQSAGQASPGPTASVASAPTFTADGVGPYVLGAKLSELQAAGLLAEMSSGPETCMMTAAQGTGPHKDVRMVFGTDGILRVVTNRSAGIATSSGARLGNTLAELQTIYGTAGQKLTRDDGAVAYLVTATSNRGILFSFDDKNKVAIMAANDASKLKASFLEPVDAC